MRVEDWFVTITMY